MKRKRLPVFVLFSVFLHMGLLLGVNALWKPSSKIIPIDPLTTVTVVLEEEPIPATSELTFSEQPVTGKALETKSLMSVGTETLMKVQDLAGPIPREGTFEPSLNVESMPTLGALPEGRQGREVTSNPTVSRLRMPALNLSSIEPTEWEPSLPLEVEMPTVLVEAETGGIKAYSQTQEKIETPVGRNRATHDSLTGLSPIPTAEAPVFPEEREMTPVVSRDIQRQQLARSEIRAWLQPLTDRKHYRQESPEALQPTVPGVEPSIPDLESALAFPVPGSSEGAAFLFVLDTSGSVKGAPLEGIKGSAWEFLSLMGPHDRAGIMVFNDNTELVRPFTSKKELLRREIENVRTRGTKTVLFDALVLAIDLFQREKSESKFLILFSDGKDEGSRSTLRKVIQKIRLSGVSVLCVGYSRVEKEYLQTLENIAAETDGIFTDAPRFHEIVMLYRAARNISG